MRFRPFFYLGLRLESSEGLAAVNDTVKDNMLCPDCPSTFRSLKLFESTFRGNQFLHFK